MLIDGLMISMKEMMIRLQTSTYMGEGQIHPSNYKEDDDISNTLKKTKALEIALQNDPLVKAYSPRIIASGMLSSSYESQIVRVVGVDFSKEKDLSKLKSSLVEGNYPTEENKHTAFIMGFKLAQKLSSQVGEKIILTFSEQSSSNVSQEMFRLSGITRFNMRPYDDFFVFVDKTKASKIFGLLESDAHEFAIRFTDSKIPGQLDRDLKDKVSNLGSLYESWGELAHALKSMLDMTQYSMAFIYTLVFIFILFAILNTMFMSIFERSFEFGILKALGTKGWQVAYLILSECFSIGFLGAILGCLLGFALMTYLNTYGISYSGSEFNGISLSEPIRPVLRWQQFTFIPLSIVGITMLSGLYPAIYTARMKISNAMHKSL